MLLFVNLALCSLDVLDNRLTLLEILAASAHRADMNKSARPVSAPSLLLSFRVVHRRLTGHRLQGLQNRTLVLLGRLRLSRLFSANFLSTRSGLLEGYGAGI